MLSQKVMVQNILATYAQATPVIVEDGMTWYLTGNSIITDIAHNSGHSVEHVAVAMAHLSPRVFWSRNVLACERVCSNGEKPAGIMGRSWNMARLSLMSRNPLETLNGNKVQRFAANLLGDTHSVTIDIWAIRVAAGERWEEIKIANKGVYAKIEKAYQATAEILGIEPAHLQATVWIVARGRKG